MREIVEGYVDALVIMMAEMSPYLMLGFLFAGLLKAFVPSGLYQRHLTPRTMSSVVKAALFGIPLPLCSCGVIPTAVSLRRQGASHGACASFLIATPQTGVDSIAATYSLMGLPFAVVRPVAALLTSLFGGWLVNRYAQGDEQTAKEECPACCEGGKCQCSGEDERTRSLVARILEAMRYAFVEMLQDVGKWLVVGLLIAAFITVAVPQEWLAALHEYKLLNMLIVLAVAIPMYVCATGSIPIAVSLMAKGLTPGAALVLLMAGPAVNSASMMVIGKVFGRRMLALYVGSIVAGAVFFGLVLDYLFPSEWFAVGAKAVTGAHCSHCLGTMDWLWLGLFVLLLINAFVQRVLHSRSVVGKEEGEKGEQPVAQAIDETTYEVSGMSCNHCKASVEKAIAAVGGVERVEVDLPGGKAYVVGEHRHEEVVKAVNDLGFGIEERR